MQHRRSLVATVVLARPRRRRRSRSRRPPPKPSRRRARSPRRRRPPAAAADAAPERRAPRAKRRADAAARPGAVGRRTTRAGGRAETTAAERRGERRHERDEDPTKTLLLRRPALPRHDHPAVHEQPLRRRGSDGLLEHDRRRVRHAQGRLLDHPVARVHGVRVGRHALPAEGQGRVDGEQLLGRQQQPEGDLRRPRRALVDADRRTTSTSSTASASVSASSSAICRTTGSTGERRTARSSAPTATHYTQCCQPDDGSAQNRHAARPAAHQNAHGAKVGGYIEQNWFNGGVGAGRLPAYLDPAARPSLQADQAVRGAPRPRLLAHRASGSA